MKTPTIYEIKRATEEKAPYFFTRKTMKFFGQTLKDYSVYQEDGRIFISAPSYMGRGGRRVGTTRREFVNGNDLITVKE